jgi:uncharacterized protein (TIGR00288 family)
MAEPAPATSALGKLLNAAQRLARPLAASTKVAVLVDGDNISPKIVPQLFNHVARIGEPTVKRVYANMTGTGARWSGAVVGRSLSPVHVSSVSQGKNAADIALCVDAMDLLHSKRVDAFAIVSSDSDFTRLATRIREDGLEVHGFGASHTPMSFQRACTSFLFVEELVLKGASGVLGSAKWKLVPTDAEALLVLAVLRLGDGMRAVDLSELGDYLRRNEPQFDPRVFRCRTLGELVDKLESFDVVSELGKKLVRLRIGGARNQPTSIPG